MVPIRWVLFCWFALCDPSRFLHALRLNRKRKKSVTKGQNEAAQPIVSDFDCSSAERRPLDPDGPWREILEHAKNGGACAELAAWAAQYEAELRFQTGMNYFSGAAACVGGVAGSVSLATPGATQAADAAKAAHSTITKGTAEAVKVHQTAGLWNNAANVTGSSLDAYDKLHSDGLEEEFNDIMEAHKTDAADVWAAWKTTTAVAGFGIFLGGVLAGPVGAGAGAVHAFGVAGVGASAVSLTNAAVNQTVVVNENHRLYRDFICAFKDECAPTVGNVNVAPLVQNVFGSIQVTPVGRPVLRPGQAQARQPYVLKLVPFPQPLLTFRPPPPVQAGRYYGPRDQMQFRYRGNVYSYPLNNLPVTSGGVVIRAPPGCGMSMPSGPIVSSAPTTRRILGVPVPTMSSVPTIFRRT